MPVNIDTVNILLQQNITNIHTMKKWLQENQIHNHNPKNSKEAALARVGKYLFYQIFQPYTYKQWNKFPYELNASVLQRIPINDNFDDRYFPGDKYQALPEKGYTLFIRNMLQNPRIKVLLNTDYFDFIQHNSVEAQTTIYTGPIDTYFNDSGLPKLEYRSINFEQITLHNVSFYQPNSVVNYPALSQKFTRIVEYKHLLAQMSPHTTIVKEYSTDKGDPYYPVPNEENQKLYMKYKMLAKNLEEKKKVYFVGRLANYKYFNMDQAILNAIQLFKKMYNVKIPQIQTKQQNIKQKMSLTIISNYCENDFSQFLKLKNVFKKFDTKIILYTRCTMSQDELRTLKEELSPATLLGYSFVNSISNENTLSWLNFILSKQSLFSDFNLFLRPKVIISRSVLEENIDAFLESGQKPNTFDNIWETLETKNHFMFFKSKTNCSDVAENKNSSTKLIKCSLIEKFTNKFLCLKEISLECGFIITEALLRRTLNQYRTTLFDLYNNLTAMQKKSRL